MGHRSAVHQDFSPVILELGQVSGTPGGLLTWGLLLTLPPAPEIGLRAGQRLAGQGAPGAEAGLKHSENYRSASSLWNWDA